MGKEVLSLLDNNPQPTDAELAVTLKDIESAETLLVPCRNFVLPGTQIVRAHMDTSREITIQQLFSEKGLSKDDLKRIYEEKDGIFTGLFTSNGKQELAKHTW